MCGRYALFGPVSRNNRVEIERLVIELDRPRYNAAPTQRLPVYRIGPETGPEVAWLRRGLIPTWVKDLKDFRLSTINARSETVDKSPTFRGPFRHRRCLVPMSGYYEWQNTPDGKVPFFFSLLNEPILYAAGLHEYWPGPPGGEAIESFTILVTEGNEATKFVHDRMPVILDAQARAIWLDPTSTVEQLRALLKPYPADEMSVREVSNRVNNARNDDASLVDPIPAS